MTAIDVRYIVNLSFTYGGKNLKPGDEWTPNGSRLDNLIITSKYVRRVEKVITSAKKEGK